MNKEPEQTIPEVEEDHATHAVDEKDLPKYRAKTWMLVLNNPESYGYTGTPGEICEKALHDFTDDHPERCGMVSYCLGAVKKTPHLHLGLYSPKTLSFAAIYKIFPHSWIDVARAKKKELLDYIQKTPGTIYAKKGEEVIDIVSEGMENFKGGEANDTLIEQMHHAIFELELTVTDALEYNINFYGKYTLLKQMYAKKRFMDTPYVKENMRVIYEVGKAGSGKSYTAKKLMDEQGEENVYVVADYEHPFDQYEQGERTIFLDEFKGQVRLADFLMWTDVYRHPIKCRYANTYALWDEVHIASIIPPEKLYEKLIGGDEEKEVQLQSQILRRIHEVVFHRKLDGFYLAVAIPMVAYEDYYQTSYYVEKAIGICILEHEGYTPEEIAVMPICDKLNTSKPNYLYVKDAVFHELERVGYFTIESRNSDSALLQAVEGTNAPETIECPRPATIDRILRENTSRSNK